VTTDAAIRYLDGVLRADAIPSATAIPLLLGSVADRSAALAAAGLDHTRWQDLRRQWVAHADRITRAMSWVDPDVDHTAVTFTVKDTIDVAGMPTTLGHASHRHYPRLTAPAVVRMRELGMAVVGKAYATELNIGPPEQVLNPGFPELSPAGSSTGSAVSVAAGISDFALASDVLGSARWPAANCGIAGLRTTWEADLLAGVLPVSPSQDALGLLARTVADLRWLWRRGPLPGDRPLPPDGQPVVATVANTSACAPVLAGAVRHAAAALGDLGVHVTEVELPEHLWRMRELAWELCAHDVAEVVDAIESSLDLRISPAARASLSRTLDPARRGELTTAQTVFRAELARLFERTGVDVLLMPVSSTPPKRTVERAGKPTLPKPTDRDYADRIGYTPIASFAGLPALVQPAVVDAEHGPLAVQLVARAGQEARLLDLGVALERTLRAHQEVAARVAKTLAGEC
jgi:Asp-tRNA(Asn)/Glu-tRNA(Gln) amidotransferase A subunit family amidase